MKIYLALLFAATFGLITSVAVVAQSQKNLASSLLTPSAIIQILGASVEPESGNTSPDVDAAGMLISHCAYRTSESGRNATRVDLMLRRSATADAARGQFEGAKTVYAGKEVSGVGDAAFRSALPEQLHVLKGRVCVIVTAGKFKADPELEQKVATYVLRALPD